mgnify:FL=1
MGDLYKDVDRLGEADSHLLGSMVCLTEAHQAGINQLEVVDGQQRLTTLMILLDAISERYQQLGEDENRAEILPLLSCKGPQGERDHKLKLGDLDDPDFRYLMDREMERMVNTRLLEAYKVFMEWIGTMSVEALNSFCYKLINNVDVIRLDVAEAKDAYKLFETINNRGLSLSPTDIIKNFLLGHASQLDQNVLKKVQSHWQNVIVQCDGIDTDDFFRQYMCCILRRKVSKTLLIDTFKKHYLGRVKEAEFLPDYELYFELGAAEPEDEANLLDGEDLKQEISEADAQPTDDVEEMTDQSVPLGGKESIIDFAERLRRVSGVYGHLRRRKFASDRINRHLYNLQRIKSFPAYILLIDVFSRNMPEAELISILKLLETFMLRRHVCEYRTGELDSIFSQLTPVGEQDDVAGKIRSHLARHLPSDSEFESKFPYHSYKSHFNRAKYVLETIEYDMIGDQGEYVLAGGGDLHLEHIIPQQITTKKSKRQFGDWEEYLGEGAVELHPDYVHRIGNLTLLAGGLNIIASNNPFIAKQEEYAKSNIQMTRRLGQEGDEFRYQEVEERSQVLAQRAVNIWRFPESPQNP